MRCFFTSLFWLITMLCVCGGEPFSLFTIIAAAEPPGGEQAYGGNEANPLGDYVDFPKAGVEIRLPKGFDKGGPFEGFQQVDTQSSVMALSFQGPFKAITAGFTKEQMSAQGWTLRSKTEQKIAGLDGILINFEQPVRGTVFLKWSVIFGDQQRTWMVTATFPAEQEPNVSDRLRMAVLSARPSRSASPKSGADLPFAVTASRKLKLTPAISNMLLYTKDGVIPSRSPKDPAFIAAQAIGKVHIAGSEREYAETRLRGTAQISKLSIESTEPVTIDGLDGYESVAAADDAKSGTHLAVYQVILFNDNSYFLMQGLVGSELQDEFLPEFKAMARSFRRQER